MAASTNKPQAPLAVRQLFRGTPRMRINGKKLAPGVSAVADLNAGAARRDLHHFGVDIVPEPPVEVKFKIALDPTAGIAGAGALVSALNPFGARVLVTSVVIDVTTGVATITWQLGHAATATGSDASILAAGNTALAAAGTTKVSPVTATGVVVPATDFFVAQVAVVAATGLVGNIHINAVLL